MRYGLFLFCAVLALTATASADTTWVAAGNVSGNWTAAHSPYMIQGNITVPTDSALAIGPGVTVYFAGPFSLRGDSAAHFSALGSVTDSIVFTTDTLANPARWRGFHVRSQADVIRFRYCVIENMHADTADFTWASFERSTVQFAHCAIRNNQSAQSIFTVLQCHLSLDSSVIAYNVSPYRVFYLGLYELALTGCEATANTGGVFWIDLADRLSLTDCRFSGNWGECGGVGWANADSNVIVRCEFEDNVASCGGALAFENWCHSRIENCRFVNNRTTGGSGGALGFFGGIATIRGCEFVHGTANYGGALSSGGNEWLAILQVEQCRFTGNQATAIGGVYAGDGVTTWTECVFDSNVAPRSAVIDAYFGSATVDHCTIVANHAADSSAMITWTSEYAEYSSLRNSVCAFNTGGPVMAANLYYADSLGHSIPGDSLHHNLFFANTGGNFAQGSMGLDSNLILNANGDSCDAFHNLYLDPRFVDLTAGDYRLLATSPCIDAGDPASLPDSDGTVADIGAYSSPYLPDAVPERPVILPPSAFILSASPNPFNTTAVLQYELPRAAAVTLKIYNLLGEQVTTLVDGRIAAGRYHARWDAGAYASGTYLALLQADGQRHIQKLLLLK